MWFADSQIEPPGSSTLEISEEPNMRHKVFYNAGAGSLPEPEASASSTDVSSFLQTLTDRQLEVMLGGLHQMFTKDEMTRLNTDIEKIKVQEMSSTGTHGSPLLIDEDQVQDVTTTVKGFLSLFTAVTVEDGEHAVKKLHRSIIDAVYIELIQRIRSENQLIEAVKTQSELLAGSLAMPKLSMFKKKSRKDNSGGHPDQDPLQSRPTAAMGGSSSVTSKKEKPRKPSIFSKMFSCFRKSAV
ncbi:hypothetical protein MHYP_G00347970 [Metynnis hypsauchen]